MDEKGLLLSGYEITSDEDFSKKLYPIPYDLDIQIDELYDLALKGKKSAIKKFIRLIGKYPRVPMLKNYLSVLYSNMGKIEKSQEVNHWIVAEHPDYLYGKLNMAAEYFMKEEYNKIPEVLGEFMELKKLFPDRDIFHISEVSGFFKIAILYFSAIGNLEQAEIRLDILREIVPDSYDLEMAEKYFHMGQMDAAINNMPLANEDTIEVEENEMVLTDIKTPPEFNHKQINLLYKNDFSLDKKIIVEILSLPRQSLIEDLNKVLEDSIIRFNHFKSEADSEGFDDMTYSFVIHALFILSEIEATESLGNILEVLRQHSDYIELFIGDILTEYMWIALYNTASSQLEICKQFMLEPGIYTYNKTVISEMVSQIALYQPKRKDEITRWFHDVLRFFLNSKSEDNVIDSDLIGILVNDILDFNGTALIPKIEELYKKEIVDLNSCGDIKEVKEHFTNYKEGNHKNDIISIFDIYEKVKLWASNDDYDPTYDDNNIHNEKDILANDLRDEQIITANIKTGRNDPCHCGSGKKYKKCCLNKQI